MPNLHHSDIRLTLFWDVSQMCLLLCDMEYVEAIVLNSLLGVLNQASLSL